jgi:hypothetical protein
VLSYTGMLASRKTLIPSAQDKKVVGFYAKGEHKMSP